LRLYDMFMGPLRDSKFGVAQHLFAMWQQPLAVEGCLQLL
jgi:hypothetical protein